MASSFEKVMEACLESKKANTPSKKITEKKTVKKTANRKAQLESVRKTNKTPRRLRESEDEEIDVDVDDVEIDEFADDTMDDVADDIMVVIDPEIDAQDIDTVADELQDIIDNTPEGETPTTDEYIGDDTYACPICGSTFFSDTEMHSGDECPVCGGTPEDFVAVGTVAPADEDVEGGEDEIPADVDFDEPTDDADLEIADTDEYVDDEELESMRRRMRRNAIKREATTNRNRRPAPRRPMSRTESNVRRPANRSAMRKPATRKPTGYQLDESTFNPFMTKFIRENYKNARSFAIKSATHFRNTHTLKIECLITMKNGKKKRATLKVENFNPNSRVMSAKDASRTFKCEGKVAPFRFSVRKIGNTIKCEGLRYNYVTKKANESVKHRVFGNYIKESAQRKPAPRKPMSRTESYGSRAKRRAR